MSRLRLIAISVSVLIHLAIGRTLLLELQRTDDDVLNVGQGVDVVLVEEGVATGVVKLGDAMQTIATAELVPVQPPPQPNEVKPDELHDVVASDASSVEEAAVKTNEPPAPAKADAAQIMH